MQLQMQELVWHASPQVYYGTGAAICMIVSTRKASDNTIVFPHPSVMPQSRLSDSP